MDTTPASDPVAASADPVTTAAAVAARVLFPRALDVDGGAVTLDAGLDALAAAGLYGLHAPAAHGGLAADAAVAGRVVEHLAGGCMTTTFCWIQHQGVVKRTVRAGGEVADRWLPLLASGEVRAGVAVGGIRPGREPLVATPVGDGWRLDGTIPWVTGWGYVDVVLVAAREGAEGDVVWMLVDAPAVTDPGGALETAAPTVRLRRVGLVACDHANSAVVHLTGHHVPTARLVTRQGYGDWWDADAAGLRTNGSLALGLAARCARLAEDDALHARVDRTRDVLDRADTDQLPAARAEAARLAWDAAGLLLVTAGGRAIGTGTHAQRLAREAMFVQVFGSRPSIRAAHLERVRSLGTATAAGGSHPG